MALPNLIRHAELLCQEIIMRLNNKNIIVTGGANGIGLATVERCLLEGTNAVIADLATTAGEQHAEELDAHFAGRCLFLLVDVSSTEQVDQSTSHQTFESPRRSSQCRAVPD